MRVLKHVLRIVLFSMLLFSSIANAATICLVDSGNENPQFCTPRTCIKDVTEGWARDNRGDLAGYGTWNLGSNWRSKNERNQGQWYRILDSAYTSAPFIATRSGNSGVTLKNGETIHFNNCKVSAPADAGPITEKWNLLEGDSPGAELKELVDAEVLIYSARNGYRIYSCTGETIGSHAWLENAVRILIDGFIREFRCNVEKAIGPILLHVKRIFWLLFTVDFIYGTTVWVLGGGRDLQALIKNIVRKWMFYGFFLWLIHLISPMNFFENGSWVGQTINSMQAFGLDIIDPQDGSPGIFATMPKAPGTGTSDIVDYVKNGKLYLRGFPSATTLTQIQACTKSDAQCASDFNTTPEAIVALKGCVSGSGAADPDACGVKLGLSPATMMIYGFSLQAAVLSAVAQGFLFNMPAIVAGIIVGEMTGGVITTYMVRFLALFVYVGIIVSFLTMMMMVVVGGQMFVSFLEMYLVCGLGVLMLAFGGSRWSNDYAVKYMGYVLVTGLKIFSLVIVFIMSILLSYGWISKLMVLAGGGAGDPGAAVVEALNPLSAISKVFEALIVYITLFIQSAIGFGVALKATDFAVGAIGGSPVGSGGALMQASMAGMNGASSASKGTVKLASGAMQMAGGAVGNLAAVGSGVKAMFKGEMNAARGGGDPEVTGGGGVHPPAGGVSHGPAGAASPPGATGASGGANRNRGGSGGIAEADDEQAARQSRHQTRDATSGQGAGGHGAGGSGGASGASGEGASGGAGHIFSNVSGVGGVITAGAAGAGLAAGGAVAGTAAAAVVMGTKAGKYAIGGNIAGGVLGHGAMAADPIAGLAVAGGLMAAKQLTKYRPETAKAAGKGVGKILGLGMVARSIGRAQGRSDRKKAIAKGDVDPSSAKGAANKSADGLAKGSRKKEEAAPEKRGQGLQSSPARAFANFMTLGGAGIAAKIVEARKNAAGDHGSGEANKGKSILGKVKSAAVTVAAARNGLIMAGRAKVHGDSGGSARSGWQKGMDEARKGMTAKGEDRKKSMRMEHSYGAAFGLKTKGHAGRYASDQKAMGAALSKGLGDRTNIKGVVLKGGGLSAAGALGKHLSSDEGLFGRTSANIKGVTAKVLGAPSLKDAPHQGFTFGPAKGQGPDVDD
ncbi:MAG: hypothetical protein V4525_07485 [Pseudomonadota bacterium]